jgi:hypothetical protein
MKELMKKHVDTIVVMGGILGSILWMNGKFSEIDAKFASVDTKFSTLTLEMNARFSAIESDIRNINTVLICRGMMPKELANDTK